MQEYIQKYGLPTLFETIYTQLPSVATPEVQVAKKMPSQIALVYGISTYTDRFAPNNQPMITDAQSENIYLVLRRGSSDFVNRIALDQLNYASNQVINNCNRWMPVIVPGNLSLDQSYYMNPQGTTDGFIALNMYYLTLDDMTWLQRKVGFKFPANFTKKEEYI